MENGGNGNNGRNGRPRDPLFSGSYGVRLFLKKGREFERLNANEAVRQEDGSSSFAIDCPIVPDESEFTSAVHVMNNKIRRRQAIKVLSPKGQVLRPNRTNEWTNIYHLGMDFAILRTTIKECGLRMDVCVDTYRWMTFGENKLILTRWVGHDIPLPLNSSIGKTIHTKVSEKIGLMARKMVPAIMQMIREETEEAKVGEEFKMVVAPDKEPETDDEEMAPIELVATDAATESTGAEQATLTA